MITGPPAERPYWLRLNGGLAAFGGVKKFLGIEHFIADKFERRSVQLIRSALDREVDDRAHPASELGGIGIGLDFELLNGVDTRFHHFRATARGGEFDRVVVDAIHNVVVLAHPLPAGGESRDT